MGLRVYALYERSRFILAAIVTSISFLVISAVVSSPVTLKLLFLNQFEWSTLKQSGIPVIVHSIGCIIDIQTEEM